MAERINEISNSTYIQLGTVISIVLLTAAYIGGKVSMEGDIKALYKSQEKIEQRFEDMPTKDYLNLKFQNIQDQLGDLKKSK